MGKKVALNVLYNIIIFFCLLIAYSGFEYARYEYVLGAVFIGAVIVTLKIKLIKEIKNTSKP